MKIHDAINGEREATPDEEAAITAQQTAFAAQPAPTPPPTITDIVAAINALPGGAAALQAHPSTAAYLASQPATQQAKT